MYLLWIVSEYLNIEKIWCQIERLTGLAIGIVHQRNEALINNMLSSTYYMYFFSIKCEQCIFLFFMVQSGTDKLCEVYNEEYKGCSFRDAEVIHKGMNVERLRKAMIPRIPCCSLSSQTEVAFRLRKLPEIRQNQQAVLLLLTLTNKNIAHPALSFSTIIHSCTTPLGQINNYLWLQCPWRRLRSFCKIWLLTQPKFRPASY